MSIDLKTLDTDLDLAPLIDHSLLDPAATPDQVEQLCAEADRFRFASVCVSPCYVQRAAEYLHNKSPKVSTVIGFPSGTSTLATKLYEAQEAVENGADELDVMINLGLLKAGNNDAVHRELAEICDETDRPVKAILELNRLTPAEKRLAAEIAMDAGVAFIKTGTGWSGPANLDDVRLLREITRGKVGIKAAGGIRYLSQAIEFALEGATRLGTSQGVSLMEQRQHITKAQPNP